MQHFSSNKVAVVTGMYTVLKEEVKGTSHNAHNRTVEVTADHVVVI